MTLALLRTLHLVLFLSPRTGGAGLQRERVMHSVGGLSPKKIYHQLETSAFVTRDSLQDALTTPPCSFQTAFAFVQFEFTAIMHLDNDFNFIGNRGINPPPPERSDVKIPKGEEQERNLDTSLSGRQLDGGSKFSLRMSNKSGRILRLMKFEEDYIKII